MQYHKLMWTPKEWNNTSQNIEKIKWMEWNHILLFKAVLQINVYHFFNS